MKGIWKSGKEKKTCVKVSFIPSRNFPPVTLIMSWQFLTPNVSVSGACATFFRQFYTHALFEEAKMTLATISKKTKEKDEFIYIFYIYIWFSILRGGNSTISPSNPPTSWGRINSGRIGGLVRTKTLWGYLSSTVWSGSVRPSSEITVKSQGGCNRNIKCSACWKQNKPVYIFVPFSLF